MLSHSYACLLAPKGARAFALRHGFTEVDNSTLVSPESLSEYQKWSVKRAKPAANEMSQGGGEVGTVGAVVRDRDGNLAAATSTGGNQNTRLSLSNNWMGRWGFRTWGHLGPGPRCGF